MGLGKQCEHRITESFTELLWELCSVILVEEVPNRNCFRINSLVLPLLVFFGKTARTTTKQKKGVFVPAEPLNSQEKRGKML